MTRPAALKLFGLGFLTLFLELVLIRYLAGTIWNLGYFPNLVLLAVFVGMGVGFVFHMHLSERLSVGVLLAAPAVLALVVLWVHVLRPAVPGFSNWLGLVGGEVYYTNVPVHGQAGTALVFLFWFVPVMAIFVMISQRTAKLFRLFQPLTAYTLDIGGSCAGILAFMAVSWLELPAWSWFLLAVPLFAAVQAGPAWPARLVVALPLVVAAALAWYQDQSLMAQRDFAGALAVRWSPYQKVEAIAVPNGPRVVFVNGIAHQVMYSADEVARGFYQAPYDLRRQRGLPAYASVLIIGAGTGNDVAAALRNGVQRVDALEIDPAIARFGRDHPARPYDDPRVTLTITDARAFMTRTNQRYDLVVFALADSLVKVSPVAQLRLENYLYTEEALRRAHDLLTDSGDILLYNYYRVPWVLEKNQAMIAGALGKAPRIIHKRNDFVMLLVGKAADAHQPTTSAPTGVDPATDDWPFPYLRQRGIPPLYGGAMAILIALIVAVTLLFRRWERRQPGVDAGFRLRLAYMVMGTAFLLLETKGVIQFSLLFGTTWLNNSLVFLAVLGLVLLANWVARLVRGRWLVGASYLLLMLFCVFTLWFPLSELLYLGSPALRFLAASALTFSPIFFANVIFSATFRDQALPELLFGWNLLGATLGGILEYSSMALGYNALALLVAVCYTIVFLLLTAGRRAGHAAEALAAGTRVAAS